MFALACCILSVFVGVALVVYVAFWLTDGRVEPKPTLREQPDYAPEPVEPPEPVKPRKRKPRRKP